MLQLLSLTATVSSASWSLIFMIVALILLFIAAFIVDGVGTRPRVAFGWAGLFFFVLSVALG